MYVIICVYCFVRVLGTEDQKSKDWFLGGVRFIGEKFGVERTETIRGESHTVAPILKNCGHELEDLMGDASDAYSHLVRYGEQKDEAEKQVCYIEVLGSLIF